MFEKFGLFPTAVGAWHTLREASYGNILGLF
jgi:hypothetical protein